MKELVLEFGEAINERIKEKNPAPGSPQKQNSSPQKEPIAPAKEEEGLESLSGQPLQKETKNNTYLQISKLVAEHPEFQAIKD